MDITLTSEIGPGSTGIVHIGRMEIVPSNQTVEVAVKLAFSEEEKEKLEPEHRIYSHLHSKGIQGIPQDFGLFVDAEDVEGDEGPYALITSFAGESLFYQGHQGKKISPSVR
jgi:hypothetical protein